MATNNDSIQADKSEKPTCIPPVKFQRNEYGLLCDSSVKYVYNEDGTINWRKMINPKFLVPHRQLFERQGKSAPKSIEGLEDRELLILLGGIKELAQIRGYTQVEHILTSPSNDYVASVCHITFIPNYETEGKTVTFSAIGDASPHNTNSFGRIYLGPIAENRAFVRAVRNFLKINIVSQEEIGVNVAEDSNVKMSTSVLQKTMDTHGVTWEVIQKKLIEEGYADPSGKKAEDYTSINDIPSEKQFELINRIQKKAKEKTAS